MEKNFGDFLSAQRKEKMLTQKELAALLFVSESAVSKWEQNRAKPDITMLPALSEILGVSEHELITASIDTVDRENKIKAKKWSNLVVGWNLAFLIAYGITLLSCFITDLATGGGLTWFWIVLTSLLLSTCFTTLPSFVRRARLLTLSLSPLAALCLLLLVCCIYSGGNWFFVASFPILAAFSTVFLPIYLSVYPVWAAVKRHLALISLGAIILVFIIMFYIIEHYTLKYGYSERHWATLIAMPIFLSCAALTVLMAAIIRYLPISGWHKSASVLAAVGAFLPYLRYLIDTIMYKVYAEPYPSYSTNLFTWNSNTVNGNVHALILITVLALAAVFLGVGLALDFKKRRTRVKK